ncbi:MAG: mycothiol system anti-sigma-R factor [Microthrixaceae bacterium]
MGRIVEDQMNDDRCETALAELYSYLDRELTEELRVEVEGHLRLCSSCLEQFDFEMEIRRIVADRCRERCPEELRARVAAALRACAEESGR